MPTIIVDDLIAGFQSPKGRPTALTPLATPDLKAALAPALPLLSLLDNPFFEGIGKLERTISGASTFAPEAEEEEAEEEFLLDTDEEVSVRCFGTPRLQSELARWAQQVVRAEEWLEEAKSRQPRPKQFLVENADFSATTTGLSFRCSKALWDRDDEVPGPAWGTTVWGVDLGDGWVQMDDHYLPLELDGLSVLTELREVEAFVDGPALTPTGQVVDLEDGASIFFACDRMWAASSDTARRLKAERRSLLASQGEVRIAEGEVCVVDAAGNVYGEVPAGTDIGSRSVEQAKAMHRKKQAAHARQEGLQEEGVPLSVAPDGKVIMFLKLGEEQEADRLRLRQKRASLQGVWATEETTTQVAAVDARGVVHL